jgi:hypothetical protein
VGATAALYIIPPPLCDTAPVLYRPVPCGCCSHVYCTKPYVPCRTGRFSATFHFEQCRSFHAGWNHRQRRPKKGVVLYLVFWSCLKPFDCWATKGPSVKTQNLCNGTQEQGRDEHAEISIHHPSCSSRSLYTPRFRRLGNLGPASNRRKKAQPLPRRRNTRPGVPQVLILHLSFCLVTAARYSPHCTRAVRYGIICALSLI